MPANSPYSDIDRNEPKEKRLEGFRFAENSAIVALLSCDGTLASKREVVIRLQTLIRIGSENDVLEADERAPFESAFRNEICYGDFLELRKMDVLDGTRNLDYDGAIGAASNHGISSLFYTDTL